MTRNALVENEDILAIGINYMGSRVGVDVNYNHLKSLYDHMSIPIDGAPTAL